MLKLNSKKLIISAVTIFLCLSLLIVLPKANNTINTGQTQNNGSPMSSTSNKDVSNFMNIMDCFKQDNFRTCLDEFITSYAANGESTKEILNDMEIARTQNSSMENQCHDVAHAIGRYTYKKYSNIGDAFDACDQSCHSGCYHGVMERMFYTDSELAAGTHLTYDKLKDKIPDICDKSKFSNPTVSVIFQCLHGVGHAILFSLDYDLRTSLKACDLLPTEYDQSSCYGGVFMENVTAFDKKKRDLKRDDYLYPCDAIDARYQQSCFLMQTSVMFEYGLSIPEIAEQCNKSSLPGTCFISLGRDLSNYVRTYGIDEVVNACEELSGSHTNSCIGGTIYALIDNTWDGHFAFKFCQALKNQTNKDTCYKNSLNYLKLTYQKNQEDNKKECEKYAGNEIETCKKFIV